MLIALLLAQAAAVETPAVNLKGKDENKTICRASGITGSRLGGQRICHTRAEWAVVDREQQQATSEAKASARRN